MNGTDEQKIITDQTCNTDLLYRKLNFRPANSTRPHLDYSIIDKRGVRDKVNRQLDGVVLNTLGTFKHFFNQNGY